MQIYADRPVVAMRQLAVDLLIVAWVYVWIRAAFWVHEMVGRLAVPGEKLQDAGTGIADNLAEAGAKAGRVPVVGDELTAPFTRAADAARALADVGRDQQEVVGRVSTVLAVSLLVFPLALVLFGWLPRRVRWIRVATAAVTLRRQPVGRDLLALRALAGQPLRRLAALDPDVAAKWRVGDPAAVAALAALELRTLGLRGSAVGPTPPQGR